MPPPGKGHFNSVNSPQKPVTPVESFGKHYQINPNRRTFYKTLGQSSLRLSKKGNKERLSNCHDQRSLGRHDD